MRKIERTEAEKARMVTDAELEQQRMHFRLVVAVADADEEISDREFVKIVEVARKAILQ